MLTLLTLSLLAAPGPCPDFAAVYAQANPAVLRVVAGRTTASGGFLPERTGAGFVWDAQGHVVTNDHLIGDAPDLRVRTAEGRVYRAALVGQDGPTDLAVLKVKRALPCLPHGAVEGLRVGQPIAAIGHPFGLPHALSVGVISGLKRRNLPNGGPKYADFIQTDLTMNPGNSGGPLLDVEGAVIGMNTAILGDAQGVAFAIPIDMLEVVIGSIIAHGRFLRGFAGFFVKDITRKALKAAGMRRPRGAQIRGLITESPAHAAGLAPGDIILKFDDTPIEDKELLPWLIAAARPGQLVHLRVARGPERLDLTLTIGSAQ